MDRRRYSGSRYNLLQGMGEHLLSVVCESAPREQLGDWLRVPLEHAAANGDLACVEKLVSAGADACVRRRGVDAHRSPLVAACQAGDPDVLNVLLRSGAGPDGGFRHFRCNNNNTSSKASTSGNVAVHKSSGIHRSRDSFAAVGDGNCEAACERSSWSGSSSGCDSSSGSSSDEEDSLRWSPLHYAAAGGHVDAVRALVAAGADKDAVDDENCTALHLAVFRGYDGVVEALVAEGANVDTHDIEGETPLHTAAGHGNLNMVRAILKASPPEVINGNGGVHLLLSPLHRAALGGHSKVMRELLAHGARLDSLALNARTALHACAMSGSGDAVRLLLEQNAALEAQDDEGCTATHIAAGHRLGSDATLEAILLAGANMEAKTKRGETPLHRACKAFRADSVKRLLHFGADERAVDGDGRTPAALASGLLHTQSPGVYRNRLDEILSMLEKAPADRIWSRRGWLVIMRTRHRRRESWFAVVAAAAAECRRKQQRRVGGGVLVNLPNCLPRGARNPYTKAEEDESYDDYVLVRSQVSACSSRTLAKQQQENLRCKRSRTASANGDIVYLPQPLAVGDTSVLESWCTGNRVEGQGQGAMGFNAAGVLDGNDSDLEGVAAETMQKFRWIVQKAVGVEEDGVFRTMLGFL